MTTIDPQVRQLSPKMRTVWRVRAAIAVVAVSGLLLALAITSPPSTIRTVFFALTLGALVTGSVAAAVLPGASWSRWSYTVLPDALDLEHGVLTRRRSTVPYFRVQHIDLRSGPIERSLGLTRLVIRTASATSDSELPGLSTDDAEQIRRFVLERAGHDDAV